MIIFVGNLSFDITEEELRREFMVFGEVMSIIIMDDKHIGSGQTRRYAFVEMPSKSEGEDAVTGLKGKRLRNRAVDVIGALPLSDKDNSFRKGRPRSYTK